MKNMNEKTDYLILDGDCGLCNQIAIFIEKYRNKDKKLTYLSIKSEHGKKIIAHLSTKMQSADSVYLVRNNKTYIRSAAGIRILLYLNPTQLHLAHLHCYTNHNLQDLQVPNVIQSLNSDLDDSF